MRFLLIYKGFEGSLIFLSVKLVSWGPSNIRVKESSNSCPNGCNESETLSLVG